MNLKFRVIPKLHLQWFSAVGEGMQLELFEAAEDGSRIKESGPYPAATILANETETLFFEIYPDGKPVRIPLIELEKALKAAKEGVHGEVFYDKKEE